jgi:hypothetical protein
MMMPELPESTQQLSHQGPTEIPNLWMAGIGHFYRLAPDLSPNGF